MSNFVGSESGLAYVTFPNLKVVDLAVATRRLFLNLKLLTPHLHRTADRCAALLLLVKKGKTRGCNRLSNYRDPGTYSKRSPGMIQPCIESSNRVFVVTHPASVNGQCCLRGTLMSPCYDVLPAFPCGQIDFQARYMKGHWKYSEPCKNNILIGPNAERS